MANPKKNEFDNFDEFAEDYRDLHDKSIKLSGTNSTFFSEYKIVELTKLEDTDAELNILDFGCGDGESCIYFRKHFKNASITGIDISEESINKAKEKNLVKASFSAFDGFNIDNSDESFDVVFTSMVFHHIDHKLHQRILKEIHRVLKTNGRFYIFEHNPLNPLTRKVVRECVFDEDAVLLNSKYAKNSINDAGFKSAKTKFTIFIPRHKFLKWLVPIERFLTKIPFGAQYFIRTIK